MSTTKVGKVRIRPENYCAISSWYRWTFHKNMSEVLWSKHFFFSNSTVLWCKPDISSFPIPMLFLYSWAELLFISTGRQSIFDLFFSTQPRFPVVVLFVRNDNVKLEKKHKIKIKCAEKWTRAYHWAWLRSAENLLLQLSAQVLGILQNQALIDTLLSTFSFSSLFLSSWVDSIVVQFRFERKWEMIFYTPFDWRLRDGVDFSRLEIWRLRRWSSNNSWSHKTNKHDWNQKEM